MRPFRGSVSLHESEHVKIFFFFPPPFCNIEVGFGARLKKKTPNIRNAEE
jgi:hypothetical protein